ncbi:MAG: hypothetical protein ACOYNC_09545 [Bacteroidales bacterium]
MKIVAIVLFICLTAVTISFGQLGITSDNTAPNSSAMLDVKSTDRGMLPPRMTFAQRNAIVNPAAGLLVICTNCRPDGSETMSVFLDGKWRNLSGNCTLPVTPAAGIQVQSNTQIIWNWNSVPIASGYKWHTSNNFAAATDMGTATSKTETGLTTGNGYTRYVWAYNACGNSEPVILTGQAFACGGPMTKPHTAGTVAPVTKTVTYGTVTGIPGATSKCWITRNLGATQQPNTVDDATEAPAGWYWQYNREQGYKHDGTTLTPAWTITTIDEDTGWEAANDPCALLLGATWRIPTTTEWINVDAAGNWTNWTGPFSSALQMHAAGYLNRTTGAITSRGASGYYWSSTQHSTPRGWSKFFNTASSFQSNDLKAFGFPLRCIRD